MNFIHRLRSLFHRQELDADMTAEMRAHLDAQTARNLAAGLSPDDARAAAHRQFGAVAQIQERARDARSFAGWENLLRDFRLAARSLRKRPGFTSAAVLTLGVGLGACGVLLAFIHTGVMTPLRLPEPNRLVRIHSAERQNATAPVPAISQPLLERLAARTDLFAEVGASLETGFTVTSEALPFSVGGTRVTPSLLTTLGLAPARGRLFAPDENQPGGPHVLLVSHGFWQSRLGARPDVIGSTLHLDGVPHEIIGVMPADLGRLFLNSAVLVPRPTELPNVSPEAIARGAVRFQVTARLQRGVTIEQVAAALPAIEENYRRDLPANVDAGRVLSVRAFREELKAGFAPTLYLLGGVSWCGLLMAAANLAGLFLTRLLHRRHEIAVRCSLGATTSRVLRTLASEAALITCLAAVVGTGLCAWALPVLNHLTAPLLLRVPEASMTAPVFGGIGLLAGLVLVVLVGLTLPQLVRVSPAHDLKAGRRQSPERTRLRGLLIAGQVGLSLALLIAATLLVESLRRLQHVPLGFDPSGLATAFVNLPPARYGSAGHREQFYRETLERLASAPEVGDAALVGVAPLARKLIGSPYAIAGQPVPPPAERPLALGQPVSDGYFRTMRIAVREGRAFAPDEGRGGRLVCVVSAALAARHFPGRSAIGESLLTGIALDVPVEIVGVVDDVPQNGPDADSPVQFYVPLAGSSRSQMAFVVRARAGPPEALQTVLRRAVAAVDPVQSVAVFQTFDSLVANTVWQQRISTILTVAFSLGALAITLIGVQGLMSFWVAQRTHEIGVRTALGATRGDVVRLVLREAGRHLAIGIVVGIALAIVAGRWLQAALFDMAPFDPLIFAGVIVGFIVLAGLSCLWPIRRATRVDPIVALRAD